MKPVLTLAVVLILTAPALAESQSVLVVVTHDKDGKATLTVHSDDKHDRRAIATLDEACKAVAGMKGWGSTVHVYVVTDRSLARKDRKALFDAIEANAWLDLSYYGPEAPKNLTDYFLKHAPAPAKDPVPAPAAAADEKTIVATGTWSEPVNGLRGRLVLARGRTLGDGKTRESLVYVELENVANTHSGKETVAFDPDALKCELTDSAGKAVAPAPVPGSGGRPGKSSVTIPFDSSIRLRANPYAFGRAEGLLIPLNNTAWHIKDEAEYSLSGTLTVAPPDDKADGWKGELKLPGAKIALKSK